MVVLPEGRPPPLPGKTTTIVANLRREAIDELISTLEALDSVGGRHLKITVRDGFEIENVPEQVAPKLEALLSDLGIDHYTLERSPVHIAGCHHLFDCPRDLVGTEKIVGDLQRVVDDTGVEGVLLDSVKGQVDPRSRLKIAVAGCTSCCNAPQVQDFGIMAKTHPKATEVACQSGCTRCVDICEDSAIRLVDGAPVIDSKRCTDCGQCVRVCPTETLVAERSGFEIFEGGRLGRDPKVGTRAKDWATMPEVGQRLTKALKDIAYCLEPAPPEHVEIKPDGVHLPGPASPMVHEPKDTMYVPEPPRAHRRD